MLKLFVLYEHATGYAVFKVKQFEEVGMFLPQIEAAINDFCRFQSLLKLVSFSQFKSSVSALENMNAISEGVLTDQLQTFVNTSIEKKRKSQLGVLDPKLAAAIANALNISCTNVGAVPELVRVIRNHFPHLMQTKYSSINDKACGIAQLGLGHAFSRAQIKFNVNRVDNMIIQSIALLDQLDKDVNSFYMRIREWYSYHYPELVQIVPDMIRYARLVKLIQDKKTLSQEKLYEFEETGVDTDTANAIIEAARFSIGMDINPIDMINIVRFANRVISLAEYRTNLAQYLNTKMAVVAPNLAILVGDLIGARLISRAGSLTNLAKMPASTVQILGAEKALFRALKTRSSTPKYGLLYNASHIGRAGINKGRISRYLAAKCSIAARIDCFADPIDTLSGPITTNIYGKKLREQVENRLRFYEAGEIPIKNQIVMEEAKLEIEQLQRTMKQNQYYNTNQAIGENLTNRKKRKRKHDKDNNIGDDIFEDNVSIKPKVKKIKKKKKIDNKT